MGTAAGPALSVVVPVFNEEGNVEPLFEEITRAARSTGRTYEIVFVNDGSRDRTLERLRSLAARDPHLRVVDLDGNFGEAAALSAGFASARGTVVATLDGDGQNDPNDIPRLLEALGSGVDVASGRRQRREEPFFTRVLPSRVANGLIAALTRVPVYDCGCGLKAYRRDVLRDIQLPRGMNRFLPAILGVDGRRVVEVATRDRPRGSGTSHYGLSRVFVVFRDLLALPLLVRRPLPNAGLLGALGAAVALLGGGAAASVAGAILVPGLRLALLGVATGLALAATAAYGVRFNVTRFKRAQEDGVFRVRKVLDHGNVSAEDRPGRRGVLGEEPAPDLRPSADGADRPALRP